MDVAHDERELAALLGSLPRVPPEWRELAQAIPQQLSRGSGSSTASSDEGTTDDVADQHSAAPHPARPFSAG